MFKSASMLSHFGRRNRARIAFLNLVALLAAFLFVDLPIATQTAEAASTTVVISEFRVRGPEGGSDEFIELYNLSASPVDISGWKVNGSNSSGTTSTRVTIAGGTTLNPGCYYLLTNSSTSGGPYSGSVVGNQTYATGITDDGGIALLTAADVIVDQVGMSVGSAYKEGTPLTNLGSTNADRGYERGPGGGAGNGTDTDDNSTDFQLVTPSNPQTGCSGPTPTPTATPEPSPSPTATPTPSPTPTGTPAPTANIIINELDSDTPGTDVAEFVEIYDGGTGNSSLNGMVMVFYNGSNGLSYRAIDLSGLSTNSQGYFTVGNSAVPNVDLVFANGSLQNGRDAVAIFSAPAGDFPNGTAVTTSNLVDAIVYDSGQIDGAGLFALLNPGQPSVVESSGGNAAGDSNQRCQNGEGGQRNTTSYLQRPPTPGAANNCPAPPVFRKISEIQGSGSTTPFAGLGVISEGIVTAKKTNGFFLQEPDASVDADPNTSEGIFVFTSAAPTVNVGDFVNVTGNATEFFNLTQISSSNANIIVSTSGNPLPTPIALTTTILDANGAIDQLERFEGMRMSAETVVSVAPTNNFGEIWSVLDGVARPFREPGIEAGLPVPPDPSSGLVDCCIPIWDRNPERIMIDTDGLAGSTRINVTSNVTLTGIIGPLDFSFDDYKIVPEITPGVASANMDAVPVRATAGSEFSVAGYNIENFTGNATQAAKASLAIRNVMNLPDVIGTIEISTQANLQALADRVNADVIAAGGTNPAYQAYLIQAPAGGSQNLGFLVKTSRIQVNNVVQEQSTRTFTNPTTGGQDILHDRPPLVLHATVNPTTDPRPIIVVVNHLRSFIDADLVGGAGPRVREKRKVQGEATAELLQQLQSNNAGVPVISVGDYNAYQFSDGYTDPIATIKGTATNDDEVVVDGSPDLVSPDYVNLVDSLPESEQYSFIFEGTPQALDHIIVNESAASILKTFGIARMNADFPEILPADATSPLANSDHDAPIAIFQFPQRETTTSVTDVNVVYNVNGQNIDLSATVSTTPNTVNEGTVTFTVTSLDGGTIIATVGPVDVADGEATASFFLPGTVLPQELRITAEFSGGDTTLPSTGTGSLIVRYAVCTLYDESMAVRSGAVYPIKLQLCDVNGVNVSSAGIRVTATSINLISVPDTDLEVTDSGNSNPDHNFRYDAGLAGYIFNLKTTGLASGAYRLNFTAGDDPTVHSVEFRVK